jgi:hypothetical protein
LMGIIGQYAASEVTIAEAGGEDRATARVGRLFPLTPLRNLL